MDPFGTAALRAAVLDSWAGSPTRFREDANADCQQGGDEREARDARGQMPPQGQSELAPPAHADNVEAIKSGAHVQLIKALRQVAQPSVN